MHVVPNCSFVMSFSKSQTIQDLQNLSQTSTVNRIKRIRSSQVKWLSWSYTAIVSTITAHANDVIQLLQFLYELNLLIGWHASEDGSIRHHIRNQMVEVFTNLSPNRSSDRQMMLAIFYCNSCCRLCTRIKITFITKERIFKRMTKYLNLK